MADLTYSLDIRTSRSLLVLEGSLQTENGTFWEVFYTHGITCIFTLVRITGFSHVIVYGGDG